MLSLVSSFVLLERVRPHLVSHSVGSSGEDVSSTLSNIAPSALRYGTPCLLLANRYLLSAASSPVLTGARNRRLYLSKGGIAERRLYHTSRGRQMNSFAACASQSSLDRPTLQRAGHVLFRTHVTFRQKFRICSSLRNDLWQTCNVYVRLGRAYDGAKVCRIV